MTDLSSGRSDPTAPGAVYADPTAPVFTAPIYRPEPDPVFRDDALFASASANWRPAPVPPPPIPMLDESGELVLLPAGSSLAITAPSAPIAPAPPAPIAPTPETLRDEAVAALKAPPARYQAPASRGGARSTYTAAPPPRPSRRPPPARPPGSVTTSPSTWLPANGPTPTVPWRAQPPPPTWLPQTQTGRQTQTGPTPTVPWRAQPPPPTWLPQTGTGPQTQPGPGPVTYRARGRTPRPARAGRRRNKGWIPGVVVLAFVVLANVVPHVGGIFHHRVPANVDRAVDSYYSDVARRDVPHATVLVCPALRPAWSAGQKSATSDSRRGIVGHKIATTRSDGHDNYTVRVGVTLGARGTGPTTATIKVLEQSGTYYLCGGTNP